MSGPAKMQPAPRYRAEFGEAQMEPEYSVEFGEAQMEPEQNERAAAMRRALRRLRGLIPGGTPPSPPSGGG